jgi:hypothetical protein
LIFKLKNTLSYIIIYTCATGCLQYKYLKKTNDQESLFNSSLWLQELGSMLRVCIPGVDRDRAGALNMSPVVMEVIGYKIIYIALEPMTVF